VREERAESFRTVEARKKFYFVPKRLRQPGQPPLTLLSTEQLKILQSNYTMPLSHVERCKPFLAALGRFQVRASTKYPEPIEFHTAAKTESETKSNVYHGESTPQNFKMYSAVSKKIMKNMGFD
ncbi:hypothetical protein PJP10_31380, partial [Mycobacterium kansasii]